MSGCRLTWSGSNARWRRGTGRARALEAGFGHALIKIADGIWPYNVVGGQDLARPVVDALHGVGIEAWGWQYVYGYNPLGEAAVAVSRAGPLGVGGVVGGGGGGSRIQATGQEICGDEVHGGVAHWPAGDVNRAELIPLPAPAPGVALERIPVEVRLRYAAGVLGIRAQPGRAAGEERG